MKQVALVFVGAVVGGYFGQQMANGRAALLAFQDNSDGVSGYANLTNYGDAIGSGLVVKKGGNVGIGTASPTSTLHVVGTAFATNFQTTSFQMATGAALNSVFRSDASGNGSWVNINTLFSETDPQVSSTTASRIPKWNGSTLVDGAIFDNGNIGIGTSTPGGILEVSMSNSFAAAPKLINPVVNSATWLYFGQQMANGRAALLAFQDNSDGVR